jgi:hypothetical protein
VIRRPRRRTWPSVRLVLEDARTNYVRAGYVGRGRYVAVCFCGTALSFRLHDDPVACEKCRRRYLVRKVDAE